MIITPYNIAVAVTPSDTVDLPDWPNRPYTGLYVGVTGDVALVQENGVAVTFKAAPAGTVLNLRFRRINSTNTTATNLVALSQV